MATYTGVQFFRGHGVDLPTPRAAMTPQSIYRLYTDGQKASQYIPRRSLRSLGGYNKIRLIVTTTF